MQTEDRQMQCKYFSGPHSAKL